MCSFIKNIISLFRKKDKCNTYNIVSRPQNKIKDIINKIKKERERLYKLDWMEDDYCRISEWEWRNIERSLHKIEEGKYAICGHTFKVVNNEKDDTLEVRYEDGMIGYKRGNISEEEAVIKVYLSMLDTSHYFLS